MTDWSKVKYSYDNNTEFWPSINRINEIDDEIVEVLKQKKAELEKLTKEKDTIQNNCNHYYYLRTTGMYEDSYECKYCGHETSK